MRKKFFGMWAVTCGSHCLDVLRICFPHQAPGWRYLPKHGVVRMPVCGRERACLLGKASKPLHSILRHLGTFATREQQSFKFRFFFKKIISIVRRNKAPFQEALAKAFFFPLLRGGGQWKNLLHHLLLVLLFGWPRAHSLLSPSLAFAMDFEEQHRGSKLLIFHMLRWRQFIFHSLATAYINNYLTSCKAGKKSYKQTDTVNSFST